MNSESPIAIEADETHGRTAVLRVRGRLDGVTAPVLLDHCAKVQAEGRNLVLNLAGVSFMGSSGVGALLVLVDQFQEQAGQVRFACVSESARAVVDLLDLEEYLPIHGSEADALLAMAA